MSERLICFRLEIELKTTTGTTYTLKLITVGCVENLQDEEEDVDYISE